MSKVYVYRAAAKDTYPVAANTVVSGWVPGNLFCMNTTGEFAQLASGNNTMFVGMEEENDISTFPTGSVVSAIYGSGTRFVVDHSIEVAAGSAVRCYSTDAPLTASIYGTAASRLPTLQRSPQSGSVGMDLYCNGLGQFALLPPQLSSSSVLGGGWSIPTGSVVPNVAPTVVGKISQVPSADNNFSLGVILRV